MPAKAVTKFNKLCERCRKKCKEAASVTILSCPDFEPQPVQLEIALKFPRGRPKKPRP